LARHTIVPGRVRPVLRLPFLTPAPAPLSTSQFVVWTEIL